MAWDPDSVPRITVLGAGAMGSLFGGTLAAGGLDVTLVDVRDEHVAAINAHGLRIEGYGGERVVRLAATTDPATLTAPDVVLVQCKASHTEAAVRGAAHLFGPATIAISFQNGLGNEELIGEIVGAEKVLGGLTAQGAVNPAPGVVHNYGELPTYVGELGGGLTPRVERIAAAFSAAGLHTLPSANIRRDMWKKLLGNVGLSPTSAITNLASVEIMRVPELREVVLGAVDEAAAVGRAEGIDLDVEEARSVLLSLVDPAGGGTGESKSSACIDILNRRRTEVDWINGAIVRLGERHGVPTPINRTLVAAVKGLEAHFEGGIGEVSDHLPPLFLVRHGESEWNRAGRIQGTSESPLTDLGRTQARAVGRHLADVLDGTDFDLHTSPLGRAVETATIVCECLGRDPATIRADPRINDFRLGIVAGYPGWDAVARDHPGLARLRLEDPLRFQPPGGESGADVVRRVGAFLAEREHSGRATLVVGHGVINKFIRAVRRGIEGAAIIALGEEQDVIYRLDETTESELTAVRSPAP